MEPVNAPARRWHCACLKRVSGLRRPERNFNFLRGIHFFDLVFKYGSDINERNWLQLLFYFIVLMGIVASVIGMSFFRCVSGFRLKFCRIALQRERLQLDSKSDLTTKGLSLGFFVWKWILSLTSYLYGLKSARYAQLLFFFDDIKIFRCLVWVVFWSVLWKCLYFLAIGFCNIDWWALAMHCNFASYVCASSLPTFPQIKIGFRQGCIACERR